MRKILIILSLFILTSCSTNNNHYKITYEMCNCITPKLLHSTNNYNVYAISLEEIKITIDDQEYLLIDALTEDIITMEKITDVMVYDEIYKDGGSKYFTSTNYRILKCNTIDNNNDYYIGIESLEKQELCSR